MSAITQAAFEADLLRRPLPIGYAAQYDARTKRYFFINHRTKTTTWKDPRGPAPSWSTSGSESIEMTALSGASSSLPLATVSQLGSINATSNASSQSRYISFAPTSSTIPTASSSQLSANARSNTAVSALRTPSKPVLNPTLTTSPATASTPVPQAKTTTMTTPTTASLSPVPIPASIAGANEAGIPAPPPAPSLTANPSAPKHSVSFAPIGASPSASPAATSRASTAKSARADPSTSSTFLTASQLAMVTGPSKDSIINNELIATVTDAVVESYPSLDRATIRKITTAILTKSPSISHTALLKQVQTIAAKKSAGDQSIELTTITPSPPKSRRPRSSSTKASSIADPRHREIVQRLQLKYPALTGSLIKTMCETLDYDEHMADLMCKSEMDIRTDDPEAVAEAEAKRERDAKRAADAARRLEASLKQYEAALQSQPHTASAASVYLPTAVERAQTATSTTAVRVNEAPLPKIPSALSKKVAAIDPSPAKTRLRTVSAQKETPPPVERSPRPVSSKSTKSTPKPYTEVRSERRSVALGADAALYHGPEPSYRLSQTSLACGPTAQNLGGTSPLARGRDTSLAHGPNPSFVCGRVVGSQRTATLV